MTLRPDDVRDIAKLVKKVGNANLETKML